MMFADEMGLGKTIELLACILSHRMSVFEGAKSFDDELQQLVGDQRIEFKRLKRERVECVCGAVSENHRYKGLWVQCDICDAWQHADCVGYSPKGRILKPIDTEGGNYRKEKRNKRNTVNVIVRDEEHVCMACLELMQATDAPMATGATLIVCPAPILFQWHAEILRYIFFDRICTYLIHQSAFAFDFLYTCKFTTSINLEKL